MSLKPAPPLAWVAVPLRDPLLSASAKLLLLVMREALDRGEQPTIERLVATLAMTPTTVSHNLILLVNCGYLKRVRLRPPKGYLYLEVTSQ